MTADRFAQKAQRRPAVAFGRQQKINRVAGLVDGSVQVFPLALDPHICFVQPPADAHRTLATMKGLLQQRDIFSTQRLTVEWSTSTPRSSIISSS